MVSVLGSFQWPLGAVASIVITFHYNQHLIGPGEVVLVPDAPNLSNIDGAGFQVHCLQTESFIRVESGCVRHHFTHLLVCGVAGFGMELYNPCLCYWSRILWAYRSFQ